MGTFTPSVELDLAADFPFEFTTDIYASTGQGIYIPLTLELDGVSDFPFEFAAGIYASPGAGVYIPQAFELSLDDLPFEFAVGQGSRPALGIFSPKSVEIGLDAIQYSPLDHTVELLLQQVDPPSLGLNSMTEILHPVIPVSEVNKVVFPLDSQEYRATQKTASVVARTISTLRFRVDVDYLAAFLSDLDSKRTSQFRLTTLGYCPFGLSSQDNYVRIITRGRPQREDRGLASTVDVTFLFIATYP